VLIQQAGSRYSWWVPLLASLKYAIIDRKFKRIAVVGVPCAVQAIAHMRASDNDLLKPYAKGIRLVIGLFCTETFDYQALIHGKLKQHYKIEPHQIRKLDVKGKLEILKQDGTNLKIPLTELETCIRNGCHFCTDLTSVLADISAGAIGSPLGSTSLIVRTLTGKGFLDSAVKNKKLTIAKDIDIAAIEKLATQKIKKNFKK
jgi:coenzyme F420 hydrogenase subunit beta